MDVAYILNLPGMFAVPDCVVDEHLKLSRELNLKVLLWMLRHGGDSLELLAYRLGKTEEELMDAAQFWIDKGIISAGNEQEAVKQQSASVMPVQLPVAELPPVRPTTGQILTRTDEDSDLRLLFGEADRILKRTIGHEGQCVLLMLHDTYGLPVEVIPMLLDYCAKAGKTNNGYIEAVGRDWGLREIDSIEKADAQIAALKENLSLWSELRRLAGIQTPRPTAPQNEYLRRWSRELGYGVGMIFAAYEEMAEHTGKLSFSYMNKILEGWHAAGVKTPAQAEKAKAEFQAQRQKPAKKAGQGSKAAAIGFSPSFDLEAFERSTLTAPVFEE